jgi:hypothetical protein
MNFLSRLPREMRAVDGSLLDLRPTSLCSLVPHADTVNGPSILSLDEVDLDVA